MFRAELVLLYGEGVLLLFGLIVGFRSELHMFQQNGYKPKMHFRWIVKNRVQYIINVLMLCSLLVFTSRATLDKQAAVLMLPLFTTTTFFVIFRRPKKAKKPFVFTVRMKRQTASLFLICVAALCISALTSPPEKLIHREYTIAIILVTAQPFLVLLANLINTPIERVINHYYINDAKRLLRESPSLTVIGITGSYGKTSVKHFLTKLLEAKYDVLMTPESYNTTLGVVRTIREQLKPTHSVFVCEMGARNVGDIKEICDIVNPSLGILTSIGEQHLETFKSIENIIKTKYELADSLPPDGTLFFNGDNTIMRGYPPKCGGVTYGLSKSSDYHADVLSVSEKGTLFTVRFPSGETVDFDTILIGEHNVQNISGAIACAHRLGVSVDALKRQVKRLEPVPHRLQLHAQGNGLTIIDDAYNSNPAGVATALKTLALFNAYKILITPGMVELGEREAELNREFGRQTAAVCDFVCLVGAERTKPIYSGLLDAGFDEHNILTFKSFTAAMNHARTINSQGQKVVLIENDLPDNY